jgi:dTDP-4-dehydrorhamnose reductase
MHLLIYGHNGWIGSQFIQLLKNYSFSCTEGDLGEAACRSAVDLGAADVEKDSYTLGYARVDDTSTLLKELDTVLPSHVISFIGRTHGTIGDRVYTTIDYLEQPGKLVENIKDNLFSPISLALACSVRKIHYTYLGTGCIFTYRDASFGLRDRFSGAVGDRFSGAVGDSEAAPVLQSETGPPFTLCDRFSQRPPSGSGAVGDSEAASLHVVATATKFTEEDLPNFFGSGYSIVKGFTDRLMHQLSDNVLNLRIRMPIVAEDCPRNFITKITNYKKICSMQNSMSVLPDLLPIALDMLKSGKVGTVNLTNPGVISHNEILEMYKEYVDNSFTWENFNQEEQRQILACDRSNNSLDTHVLQTFAPYIKNIKDSVRELLQNYKK